MKGAISLLEKEYMASILYEYPKIWIKIIQIIVNFLKLEVCNHG